MKNIVSLPKLYSGKVRDLYDIDSKNMLMVASDRISTFDIILNNEIPKKGIYLTQISLFWFDYLKEIVKNHLTNIELNSILINPEELKYAKGRSVVVKKLKPIPFEAIVRGYISGSGYNDYQKTGSICGIKLPTGLKNSQKLSEPIFTPSTKAPQGKHDENISFDECKNIIGNELSNQVRDLSIKIYAKAYEFAKNHGIIIADTKFEFGLDEDGHIVLMDEVLTPDSSRFWDQTNYQVGEIPLSFDKQYLRDYLQLDLKWNKEPPIPNLTDEVIRKTQDKYFEIIKRFNISLNNV